MILKSLIREMDSLGNPAQAKILAGFFKTGKGQYGEGDVFLGIKVPVLRAMVKKYSDLPRQDVLSLLRGKFHEYRLVALLILVRQYEKSKDIRVREQVFKDYLANTKYINNWDLVDLSAPNIAGGHLVTRDRKILYRLAKSRNLWERRIAVLATFAFIRRGEAKDTYAISDILMNDTHG
jgi:3-methyladenine DNA glycosylase AlkD